MEKTSNSSVETPDAPEWLSQLEDRCEKLKHTKLSHEIGNGAPCLECGDKCSGLDLHFWRKVCRNCKCRKDQHNCTDSDSSGWAQFHILGQIRSKPAYINIKALSNQSIRLEWIPPNTSTDIITDYMDKLGATRIPISGSKAALKRKQQLEFQVPLHDLDPKLCDNLSELEKDQLQQYVEKLRKSCVGQGAVVRIGTPQIVGSGECVLPLTQKNIIKKSDGNNLLMSDDTKVGIVCPQDPTTKQSLPNNSQIVLYKANLPAKNAYEHDKVAAQIFDSPNLKNVIQNYDRNGPISNLLITLTPLYANILDSHNVNLAKKQQLQAALCEAKITRALDMKGSVFDRMLQILDAIKFGREDLLKVKLNDDEANELIQLCPMVLEIHTNPNHNASIKSYIVESKSTDSGFNSDPSTPNKTGQENQICLKHLSNIPHELGNQSTNDTFSLPKSFHKLNINSHSRKESPSLVACHDCNQSIDFGEIAVKAHRAGDEIAWHPECFKCHICRELLADLVYFFHNGRIYCGRDLAIKLKIPRCKACDELIFTKEYTAAEGASFHIKHFCCYQCDIPLAGQQYVPDDKTNMPLCLTCYNVHVAALCERCRNLIEPTDKGVHVGEVHWHDRCFICAGINCGKSLIGTKFGLKQNMPFCSPPCMKSVGAMAN